MGDQALGSVKSNTEQANSFSRGLALRNYLALLSTQEWQQLTCGHTSIDIKDGTGRLWRITVEALPVDEIGT